MFFIIWRFLNTSRQCEGEVLLPGYREARTSVLVLLIFGRRWIAGVIEFCTLAELLEENRRTAL